ncbi:MAG: restriction endonuclease [Nitrososphaerales archaeon]
MGVDGYTYEGYPIQVKQSHDIGRNPIDNFETAMRRKGSQNGVFVASSFGKGAYEEIARARNRESLNITALTAEDLINVGRELPDFSWPLESTQATLKSSEK